MKNINYMYVTFILLFLTILTFLLFSQDRESKDSFVKLPSITKDMRLGKNLTFSASVVLNETSAHFGHIDKSLSVSTSILDRFETMDNKIYRLYLNENYRSAANERITADDIIFTIKTYANKHSRIAGAFKDIEGLNTCSKSDCVISGVEKIDDNSIKITLIKPNEYFIQEIVNPWIIIYKMGKPLNQSIGDCIIPYQTGVFKIIRCENDSITLTNGKNEITITTQENEKLTHRLVSTNPGVAISPSLTVLASYFNPKSSLAKSKYVKLFSDRIRERSKNISKRLKLKWNPTLSSGWMGGAMVNIRFNDYSNDSSCPEQPVKILLDTSLPDLNILREELKLAIGCELRFRVTTAKSYFKEFQRTDIGILWFTPDDKQYYNFYSALDCSPKSLCYFDWNDKGLAGIFREFHRSKELSLDEESIFVDIERHLFEKGYVAPISQMNWWIRTDDGIYSVHPAGLAQIRLSDFVR